MNWDSLAGVRATQMAEKFDAKCVAVHGISVITTTTDAAA